MIYEYTGNSVWEYNPPEDSWKRLSDYPGYSRTGAICFTGTDKGYFGLGSYYDTELEETVGATDLWEFDPKNDTWTLIAPFPGTPRKDAVSFTINNKAFISTGSKINSIYLRTMRDVWEYDMDSDTWTQKNDFGGYPRYKAIAFSINNKGYLGTGQIHFETGPHSGANDLASDFWEYDYLTDSWQQIENYPGYPVEGMAFVIDSKSFAGLGKDGWTYYKKEIYQLKIQD
ncbi:MAG: hypothetical protein ISS19_05320 [Bacteroidales bacterium]|nr:hypothetical protein [Bacteroidales bacterium]